MAIDAANLIINCQGLAPLRDDLTKCADQSFGVNDMAAHFAKTIDAQFRDTITDASRFAAAVALMVPLDKVQEIIAYATKIN